MAWDTAFDRAFVPRSIAVLGASSKGRPGGVNMLIDGIREMRYRGRLYPINDHADEIEGYRCYPSLAALPEVPDLVIVGVNASRAEQALEECIAKGARNIHMFTAGFGETGEEEGASLAGRLREIAARGGLNVIGPNCMGIYSPRGRISPWGRLPARVGPIAFITQSGALGGEFTRLLTDHRLFMSKVVSYGNGYVMDCTDFLEYLETDPDTRYIAMYLEGVRDGRKLLEMVKRISPRKPVVILKGGETSAGARAVASHTGSLAGESAAWDAFFAQSGAIKVESMDEMVDILQALVRLPPCAGRGVGIIGGAGGSGVVATDACGRFGLSVPAISKRTQEEMRRFIQVAGTSVQNPMDIGMQIRSPEDFRRVLDLLAEDPEIDILLAVAFVFPRRAGARALAKIMLDSLLGFWRSTSDKKPLCVSIRNPAERVEAEKYRLALTRLLLSENIPVFKNVERASRALYKWTSYYRRLAETRAS